MREVNLNIAKYKVDDEDMKDDFYNTKCDKTDKTENPDVSIISETVDTAVLQVCDANDDFNTTVTAVENWGGLAEESKKPLKKRKRSYIDPDPTIRLVKDNRSVAGVIGLLRNGNISDLKTIQIEKKLYSLVNTCAFDSMFQIVCVAFADSTDYNIFVT